MTSCKKTSKEIFFSKPTVQLAELEATWLQQMSNAFRQNNIQRIKSLLYAVRNNRNNFMHCYAGQTLLHWAAIMGFRDYVELFKVLIEDYDIPVNIRDDHGDTPLHIALKNGYLNMAYMLIRYGAKIDMIDNNGEMLLQLLAKNFRY